MTCVSTFDSFPIGKKIRRDGKPKRNNFSIKLHASLPKALPIFMMVLRNARYFSYLRHTIRIAELVTAIELS